MKIEIKELINLKITDIVVVILVYIFTYQEPRLKSVQFLCQKNKKNKYVYNLLRFSCYFFVKQKVLFSFLFHM